MFGVSSALFWWGCVVVYTRTCRREILFWVIMPFEMKEFRRGGIWTTGAPYRETKEELLAYRAEGLLGVGMETAAMMAVGAYRVVEITSVLIVSDGAAPGRRSHITSNSSNRKIKKAGPQNSGMPHQEKSNKS